MVSTRCHPHGVLKSSDHNNGFISWIRLSLFFSITISSGSGFVFRPFVQQPSSLQKYPLPNVKRKTGSAPFGIHHDYLQSYRRKRIESFRYEQYTQTVVLSSTSSSSSEEEQVSTSSQNFTQQEQQSQSCSHKVEFQIHSSILSISSESWNACVQSTDSPFVEYSWLRCLEESGCVSSETGWVPQHLSMQINNVTMGYIPMYLKTHSQGEFIFDTLWANAAYNVGITYYPKLLVAIPFTPATGTRILFHSHIYQTYSSSDIQNLRSLVGTFLQQLAQCNKISSVHFNFQTEEEATDLTGGWTLPSIPNTFTPTPSSSTTTTNESSSVSKDGSSSSSSSLQEQVKSMLGSFPNGNNNNNNNNSGQPSERKQLYQDTNKDTYLRRVSLKYQWLNQNVQHQNRPYTSFDDYLQCFKSKRRIKIRRERSRVLNDSNVRIDVIRGTDILQYDGLVERMFELYTSTIDRMILSTPPWSGTASSSGGSGGIHKQYLTLDFFQLLVQSDFISNLCFMCARSKSSGEEFKAEDVFAGTFNIVKAGVFYGRYWGCLPGKEVKNLHFETCYWSAIEYCIRNGLKRMEPGAGGGDYKWARGFDAALIHSTHYICNPGLRHAVSQFLEYEIENNIKLVEQLLTKSVVGRKTTTTTTTRTLKK